MGDMIYIASPYSHEEQMVRDNRFELVAAFTAKIMKNGGVAFSPIAHCHPICNLSSMPTDFSYWQGYCLTMLDKAKVLYVLMIDGWLESDGVQAEISYAKEKGIGVCYYSPDWVGVVE